MTARIEAARFAGQFVAWGGAAAHVIWLVPFGYFAIGLAWLSGLWAPRVHTLKPATGDMPAPSPSPEGRGAAGAAGAAGS